MTTLFLKDYKDRGELEAEIERQFGKGMSRTEHIAAGNVVQGTAEEMRILGLSAKTTVWGIGCEVVNTVPSGSKLAPPPDRGVTTKAKKSK